MKAGFHKVSYNSGWWSLGDSIMSQSLVNEGRFPHYLDDHLINVPRSQSLVNEGRFPQEAKSHKIKMSLPERSQSLVNEGRFPHM